MVSETGKGHPLTKAETKVLVSLIEDSKMILSKCVDAVHNRLKSEEWVRVTQQFNAKVRNNPRTPHQLRLKWDNLKKSARKRSKDLMLQTELGDCSINNISNDEILDRVALLLEKRDNMCTELSEDDTEKPKFDINDSTGSGCDDIEQVTVSVDDQNNTSESMLLTDHNNIEMEYTDSPVLDEADETKRVKRPMFNSMVTDRKKLKLDRSMAARNNAIAEYFTAKKQCMNAKLNNIKLEGDNLKLKNMEMKLNNQKLLLETEKLKLEVSLLKKKK